MRRTGDWLQCLGERIPVGDVLERSQLSEIKNSPATGSPVGVVCRSAGAILWGVLECRTERFSNCE